MSIFKQYKSVFLIVLSLILLNSCGKDNPAAPVYNDIEQRAFDLVNQYRLSKGLVALEWSDIVVAECRQHSQNMADGKVPLGHDGFTERITKLQSKIVMLTAGENVAYNFGYDDPAFIAYDAWLKSPPHLANIENAAFNMGAIGVAKSSDGKYYLTQIFVQKK
jgi:uncharacterized protein YkwD